MPEPNIKGDPVHIQDGLTGSVAAHRIGRQEDEANGWMDGDGLTDEGDVNKSDRDEGIIGEHDGFLLSLLSRSSVKRGEQLKCNKFLATSQP